MPQRLRDELADSAVVFVKGDANYRRMLGDRTWPLDTPFADVAAYWPAPVCPLRTLKAELG
jgi:Damage-control phosphatase ARMT1-like domain